MAPNIVSELFMPNGDYYSVIVTEDFELLDVLSEAVYEKFANVGVGFEEEFVPGLKDTERFSFEEE